MNAKELFESKFKVPAKKTGYFWKTSKGITFFRAVLANATEEGSAFQGPELDAMTHKDKNGAVTLSLTLFGSEVRKAIVGHYCFRQIGDPPRPAIAIDAEGVEVIRKRVAKYDAVFGERK